LNLGEMGKKIEFRENGHEKLNLGEMGKKN
jgi:hypothetical protein